MIEACLRAYSSGAAISRLSLNDAFFIGYCSQNHPLSRHP
jgi:hypothetical protein